MLDDFAAFILTHGRPDRVYTYKSLQKHGYTGKVYIVIDNEDKTRAEYERIYGDKVVVFDKAAVAMTFDEGDNFNDRRAIIYARNACFDIARNLGIKYFIQLDDDYTSFNYKFDAGNRYGDWYIKSLDKVFFVLLEYYKSIPALSIAIAQNGDFIGGKESTLAGAPGIKRKAMNTFICSTDRPFQFFGRINEDVNTYTNLGSRGGLFMTVTNVGINQKQTQSNKGGMTELYLDSGTYVKSFYTIMYQPSSVKIAEMGAKHRRLHHHVRWGQTVPAILDEKHRKPRGE